MSAPVPPPGLRAMYATYCPMCDEPIQQGDRVGYDRGRYVHVACSRGADDE